MLEADGATISDDSAGSELLLGLRVKSTGTFDRVGIRIGYEVEGVRYTTFIPAFVRVLCHTRKAGSVARVRNALGLAGHGTSDQ